MPPSFTYRIKPSTSAFLRLRHLHKAARHLAKKAPDILAKPEVARAMEEALAEAMVLCLASAEPANVRSTHVHHATVLRRFEDVIRANPDQTLYISQLCAATGVPERTLLACCHEHLGMGPKRYLVLRRMHLARHALLMAEPEATTVTEIATNYGFWNWAASRSSTARCSARRPRRRCAGHPTIDSRAKSKGSPGQLAEIA